MPLQWHAILQTGYERYLDPDFDRTGQLLPAPMLADEWLTGPERVLRDTIERERRSLQLLSVHSLRGSLLRTPPLHLPLRGGGGMQGKYSTNAVNSVRTAVNSVRTAVNSDDSAEYTRYG
jgi:hypothetical protein